jgi:hypothetical protein
MWTVNLITCSGYFYAFDEALERFIFYTATVVSHTQSHERRLEKIRIKESQSEKNILYVNAIQTEELFPFRLIQFKKKQKIN